MKGKDDFGFRFVDEQNKKILDLQVDVEESLLTENIILRQYAECKIDNKIRLKQVQNLEDLIKFNIKTVADKLTEEGLVKGNKKNIHSLKKVCDPLLSQSQLPQIAQKAHLSQTRIKKPSKLQSKFDRYESSSRAHSTLNLNEPSVMQPDLNTAKQTMQSGQTLPPLQQSTSIQTINDFSKFNQPNGQIHPLEESDPIAKLHKYFRETGKKSPSRKAPKHNHYILQRIENQRKWQQEFRANKGDLSVQKQAYASAPVREQKPHSEDRAYQYQQRQMDKVFGQVTQMIKMRLDLVKNDKIFTKQPAAQPAIDQENLQSSFAITLQEQAKEHQDSFEMPTKILVRNQTDDTIDKYLQMRIPNEISAGQDYRTQVVLPQNPFAPSLINQTKIKQTLLNAFNEDEHASSDEEWQREAQKIYQLRLQEIEQGLRGKKLTEDHKAIVQLDNGKNPVSVLSKIAAVKTKDYITYNNDQLKLYNMVLGQNVSQRRIQQVRQKREDYMRQKGAQTFMRYQSLPTHTKVQAPKLAKAFEEDLQIKASAKPVITHDYKSEQRKSHPSTTPTRHKNEVKAFETRSNERLKPKDGEVEPVQLRGRKVDKSVEAMKMSQVLKEDQTSPYHHHKQPTELQSTLQSGRELETVNQQPTSQEGKKRVVNLNPVNNRQSASKGFDPLNVSHQTLSLNIDILNETTNSQLPRNTNHKHLGSITESSKHSNLKSQSQLRQLDVESDQPYLVEHSPRLVSASEQQSDLHINFVDNKNQMLSNLNSRDQLNVKEDLQTIKGSLVLIQEFQSPLAQRQHDTDGQVSTHLKRSSVLSAEVQVESKDGDRNVYTLANRSHDSLSDEATSLMIVTPAVENPTSTRAIPHLQTSKLTAEQPYIRIESKRATSSQATPLHPPEDAHNAGYVTATDNTDRQRILFAHEILSGVKIGKKGWQAKRFKKFPRFSIYLSKGDAKEFLERNYISLSNQVIQFLAQDLVRREQNETDSQKIDVHTSAEPQALKSEGEKKQQTDLADESIVSNYVSQKMSFSATQILKAVEDRRNSEQQTSNAGIGQTLTKNSAEIKMSSFDSNANQSSFNKEENNPPTHFELINTNSEESIQKVLHYEPKDEPAFRYVLQQYHADPFEKVLLLKNIDNAILTSYRTLSKQNNQISQTMKVLHQKFLPLPLSKKITKLYTKAQKRLYPVSEMEEDSDEPYDAQVLQDIEKITKHGINQDIDIKRVDSLLTRYKRVDSEIIHNPTASFNKEQQPPEQKKLETCNSTKLFANQSEDGRNAYGSPINAKKFNENFDEETSTIREQNDTKAQSKTESFKPKSKEGASKSVIMIKSIYRVSENQAVAPFANQQVYYPPQESINKKITANQSASIECNIVNMNLNGVELAALKNDKFAPSRLNSNSFKRQNPSIKARSSSKIHAEPDQTQIIKIHEISAYDIFGPKIEVAERKLISTQTQLTPGLQNQKLQGRSSKVNTASSNYINIHMPKMHDRTASQMTEASHEHKATIELERQSKSGLGDTQISHTDHTNRREMMAKVQGIKRGTLDSSHSNKAEKGFSKFISQRKQAVGAKASNEDVVHTFLAKTVFQQGQQPIREYNQETYDSRESIEEFKIKEAYFQDANAAAESKKVSLHIREFKDSKATPQGYNSRPNETAMAVSENLTVVGETSMIQHMNSQIIRNATQTKESVYGSNDYRPQEQDTRMQVKQNQSRQSSPLDELQGASKHLHFPSDSQIDQRITAMQKTQPFVSARAEDQILVSSTLSDSNELAGQLLGPISVGESSKFKRFASSNDQLTLLVSPEHAIKSQAQLITQIQRGNTLKSAFAKEDEQMSTLPLQPATDPVITIEAQTKQVKVDAEIQKYADKPEVTIDQMLQKTEPSPVRMKALIDSLYEKEKKFIYQKQGNTRADFVGNQSVIFNLEKVHDLPLNNQRQPVHENKKEDELAAVVLGQRLQLDIPPSQLARLHKVLTKHKNL